MGKDREREHGDWLPDPPSDFDPLPDFEKDIKDMWHRLFGEVVIACDPNNILFATSLDDFMGELSPEWRRVGRG